MGGFDRIIHLRATEKCDLRCMHCFVPPNAAVMDENLIIDQVEAVLATMQVGRDCSCNNLPGADYRASTEGVRRRDAPNNLSAFLTTMDGGNAGYERIGFRPPSMEVTSILLQWHGGEPTLLSSEMVGRIITHLNSTAQRQGLKLHHGIQTNLTALYKSGDNHRSEWIELLRTVFDPDQIGVSFDFGLRGTMAEAIFEFALKEIMVDQGIRPWVTMTLARPLYERLVDDPLSLLKRFGRVGGIRFEPLSPHGYARDHWDEIGINHTQRCEAMIQVLNAWWPRRAYLPAISPLGEMMGSLMGEQFSSACLGQQSVSMMEIDRHGTKERCVALQGKSTTPNIPLSCLNCEWRQQCRQGCPALPFFDGSEASASCSRPSPTVHVGECRGGAALWDACHQLLQQSQTIPSGINHG